MNRSALSGLLIISLAVLLLIYLINLAGRASKKGSVSPSGIVPGGGSSDMIEKAKWLDADDLPPQLPYYGSSVIAMPGLDAFFPLSHSGDGGVGIPAGYLQ